MDKSQLIFTKDGFENLKEERQNLIEKRPGVVERLSAAREQGDLSENAGYHAAKDELAQLDSRVRELNFLITNAKISQGDEKGEKIAIGSKVSIENSEGSFEYTIVNALETDPAKGKLSDTSPIGQALIGKKIGDRISAETPAGKMEFIVKSVE
jgi:transcription elongation factor GreA